MSLARHLVPCEWSTLYVADEKEGAAQAMHQVLENGTPGVVVKYGEGVAGAVAQTLAVVTLRSPDTDPRFKAAHYGQAAAQVLEILALPLLDSHGSLKGVLELRNRSHALSFRKTDAEELMPFCKLAGITLHNASMLQVARRTAASAGTRLERRNSMMGIGRRTATATPAPIDALSAAADHSLAAACYSEAAPPVEPLELLSKRKIRASAF